MAVTVLVPLAGDGTRGDVWRWLRAHYWESEHPEWRVEVGTDSSAAFSKGRAVADAFYRTKSSVLVVSDADSFIPGSALADAVYQIERGHPWVVPFSTVHRLSTSATAGVLAGRVREESELRSGVYRTDQQVVPGGGMVVLSRQAYETVGGIDPRFTVWGAEVDSFGWALTTLVGEPLQLGGTLWHLWHRPGKRREAEPELNKCLGRKYRAAYEAHDAAGMRRLCDRDEGCD